MKIATCLLQVTLTLPCIAAQAGSGYIGTYTSHDGVINGSAGISTFHWDANTGSLSDLHPSAEASNPSFLVIAPNGRFVYAVNEGGPSGDSITAFAVVDSGLSRSLRNIGSVSSMGAGPCHVILDWSGRWLFVANYRGGSIAVFSVQPDGTLSEARQVIQQPAVVGMDGRNHVPHAHEIVQSPDGRFVLSVDLGLDKVFIYRFDASTGMLTANEPAAIGFPLGFGPRHLIFSNDARRVYLLTELTAKLITLGWDTASGTLTQLAEISTLTPNTSGAPSAAELVLSSNGKWLYVSNRGQSNSIASFRIDNGLPNATGSVASGGITPRFIVIDPTGKFLLAANQDSNNIAVFRIDQHSGTLTPERDVLSIPAPVDLVFDSLGKR